MDVAADTRSAKLSFVCDYSEGAHPEVLARLVETNMEKVPGYGNDHFCESARAKIREACACPDAAVHFLVGGTQVNAVAIDSILAPYQGVVAATSGHISVHESGAVERLGHKIMTLPAHDGKLDVDEVEALVRAWEDDENHDHMVMPGMVYITHPTESGTLYTLRELEAMSALCRDHGLKLYLDGARLAYALGCDANDVSLPDIARLCDAFYIGGTKCGALFGEALVMPDPDLVPHFFSLIKQHGALLAKGRLLGVQFDALFTDGLYGRIGRRANEAAVQVRSMLERNGYQLRLGSQTNQSFVELENSEKARIAQSVDFDFWEKVDDDHTIIRLCVNWATTDEDLAGLERVLEGR